MRRGKINMDMHMLNKFLARVGVVFFCCCTLATVQCKTCTPKDAEAADEMVDHLDSWEKVESARKQFGHCDDGSIAEGNSEAVARLLVDRWDTLPALTELIKRDPALKRFVLRHIDSTLGTDDLDKIKTLAASKCPADAATLCGALKKSAIRAEK